jgi:hypothetical protein
MPRTAKPELTAEAVIAAIESAKPDGITKLARALGYQGSVSSWLKSKLTELVPDLADRIKANRAPDASDAPKAAKEGAAAKPRRESGNVKKPAAGTYPRSESNPFRDGSSYACAYDVLSAAGASGIERSKLVAEVARLAGKALRKAYFDVTVVASSRKDGGSHKCISRAADRFYVDRTEGGWLKLVLR